MRLPQLSQYSDMVFLQRQFLFQVWVGNYMGQITLQCGLSASPNLAEVKRSPEEW